MIAERELTEYRNLSLTLASLHEKFLVRRQELRRLLAETAYYKTKALLILAKANRLTRHLTGRQRQVSGLTYFLGDIKARVNQAGQVLVIQEDILNRLPRGEGHRQDCLVILGMIDTVKKNLFQIDLLELRCRELIISINKALEAFRHEWKIIRRKIYPFGIFSLLYRSVRRLWGNTYFSFRDMDDIAALGNITGLVLKTADSPLV